MFSLRFQEALTSGEGGMDGAVRLRRALALMECSSKPIPEGTKSRRSHHLWWWLGILRFAIHFHIFSTDVTMVYITLMGLVILQETPFISKPHQTIYKRPYNHAVSIA